MRRLPLSPVARAGSGAPPSSDSSGSLVNVGSIAGTVGALGPQAYSAAKAAGIRFTRIAAAELAPQRIRVNSVSPGVIRTPLVEMGGQHIDAAIAGIQPWPDMGQADQVAKVIEFLADWRDS